jgi:DNA repair protein RecN (Recombination protein N)
VLTQLYIKNFAIIAELELQLQNGLLVLTGETGAGKSIILGAINLLLGARADSNSLYNKDEKCIIEAHFNVKQNAQAIAFLVNNEIESTDELIIRREIQSNGKSRAFVNDTPVLLNKLETLGECLIDLHRQFDTMDVKDSDYQLQIIDTIAGNSQLVDQYKAVFKQYKSETENLHQLQQEQQQLQQEFDYNSFQYKELNTINFTPHEIENAEQQLAILSNAENLKQTLTNVAYILSDNDTAIIAELKTCINQLNQQSDTLKKLQPIVDRLNSNWIDLKDIATEIEDINETIEVDQSKLDVVLDRFNEGMRLLKKHNLSNTTDLLQLQETLHQKLQKVSNSNEQISAKTQQVNQLYQQVVDLAQQVSKTRSASAKSAMQQVNQLLPKVGMPVAKLQIDMASIPCASQGADKINFLFDANNTNKFLPIAKSASGGELSRLMLCIKSLLAKANQLSTLVFDEIDTGISGEVAKQVAVIMQQLSQHHQIITVTHLPQIAAKAQHHLYVYKATDADKVVRTKVKALTPQERITHIAEMLSGKTPTDTAIQTAKELMQQ